MQTKILVLLVLMAVFSRGVNCQSESGGEDGFWSKLKKAVREFMDSLRDIWKVMKERIKEGTKDMTAWTKEMFDSFQIKMKEWVNEIPNVSESEKHGMREYIERLQMPKDPEQ